MTDEDEISASNDYATGFALKNRDIVYGNWLAINPAMKDFWLKEYARLAAKKPGFLGFCQSQNSLGYPASDPDLGSRSTSSRSRPARRCSS